MPYKNISELPESVQSSLPEHAQVIYMNVVNSQEERGLDESAAAASAWAAVKRSYEKGEDGKWNKIEKADQGVYISRKVLNDYDFIEWAKDNGFDKTVSDGEMHVTISFSRDPFEPGEYKQDAITIKPNQYKSVEPLGDDGAFVLKFDSDQLQKEWKECIDKGASWDYESYMPHMTITYYGQGVDLSKVKLPTFPMVLGERIIAPLDLDWKDNITEKAESHTPPQGVQDAAKRGLELRSNQPDSNKCCTSVGIARARDLSNGKSVSLDTVKRMKAYFDRHEVDKKGEGWGRDSKGYQAWLMWGGDPGQTWANKIVKENDMEKNCGCFGIECEIKKIDQDKQLVYGWAYVSEKGGEFVIDHSGEHIYIDDLQEAAHEFMLKSRRAKEVHKDGDIFIGDIVESVVFTKELQKQLGIDLGKVGWMICMKVWGDDVWNKVKGGEYKMFSIGGASRRVEA